MSPPAAPDWPRRVVAIGATSVAVARGTNSEFLHDGIALAHVPNAAAALVALAHDAAVAAVLLPLELPDMALDDFIEIVRAFAQTSVIVGVDSLTPAEVSAGMRERGAAATVVLPVTPNRLAQALRAVPIPTPSEPRVFRCGDLELDIDAFRVHWYGEEVRLPPRVFEILHYLMAAYPRAVTLQELVSEFVPSGNHWRTDSIRVAIRRLREQLEAAAPGMPVPVETVKKVGYRITDGSERTPVSPMSATSTPTLATTSSLTHRTNALGRPIGSASVHSM